MRAALLQMTSGIDPLANARTLTEAVRQAQDGGAAMLFTPEMSGLIDRDRARAAPHIVAEDDDPVLAAVREAAAAAGVWVHLGSLAVRAADGRAANRGFVIDGGGRVRARYDKLHLFDVDLPGGEQWRESAGYVPGDGAVVVDTPAGRLGLSICYDLRFPDLYRALSDAGATVLRARAIEAGAFVIAAAQAGSHADGRTTYGHSLAVDPWGEVLLDLGEEAGLGFVDLEQARLDDVRARIPVLSHRRAIPAVAVVG
jgi:deaminated glutathione amidase